MNEIELIQKEKIDFIGDYSVQLYNNLIRRDSYNNTIIYTITSLLINNNPLLECEEYKVLTDYLKLDDIDIDKKYLSSILGSIISILSKIGSYDNLNIVISYLNVKNKVNNDKVKSLVY